tara:strand:- start:1262 stop:2272 length:1011 start_codon:yes stop_codon:yes gene_type:complete
MGLQSSDKILVERSSTLYRETYGNRANINSSDLLLVDRGGTLYKCAYSDWPNATSTDLILVERGHVGIGNTMYKETKANWPTTSNVDIHSANYMVTLGTLLYNKGDDSTNPYSVVEVHAEFSSSATVGQGTLYIGFRNSAGEGGTTGYPYYGDLPIAAVQILQSNGTTIRNPGAGVFEDGYTWNFADAYDAWYTSQANITSKTASPAAVSYYSIGTSATAKWFSFTSSGTVSSQVGAAQGIPKTGTTKYTNDDTTTSILPVGTANVAQSTSSTNGYIFTECSGMSTGNLSWLACESMTGLQNGDRIRICYFGGGNGPDAAKGLQTTDSLYVRYIED